MPVSYQPESEDTLNARLKLTSNDPSEPISVIELTGSSFDPTGVEDGYNYNYLPEKYKLHQNYPNPFNPDTVIRYQIIDGGSPVHTSLKVYNVLGQEIYTLVDTVQGTGVYAVTWNAKDTRGTSLPSGMYLYRLQAGDFTQSKRMVYVR
jgi:hypothetical protein